jgi:tRNA G18 (ribose-2'-O)-methylase SpoU
MSHRGVAAIENHVGVANGREITGTVYQKKRDMQVRFEQAVNQPARKVALPRVDQNAADKVARHHDGSGTAAVVDGGNVVGL